MSDPNTSSSGLTRRSFVQTAPPDGSARGADLLQSPQEGQPRVPETRANGDWYLFKHSKVRNADEYAKVRPGDFVGERYKQVKKQLAGKV